MSELTSRMVPNKADKDPVKRGWPLVLLLIAALSLAGWGYLGAMIAAMVPVMDMSTAGPGMAIFNEFNLFKGLPADARAALAVICLPTGATTFGMPSQDLTAFDLLKVLLMWLMMALAMMLPSATPMLKAFSSRSAQAGTAWQTMLVAFGYLLVWGGYALVATLAQWGLTKLEVLTDMMAPASMALSATVLLAAGIYQFTPAKQACLVRCWYPRWVFAETGKRGWVPAALREGVVQGVVCLGCCWAVMTVMFAVGLMNIVWIALLGALMAIEKTFPSKILPKALGVLFLAWGGALAAAIMTTAS